MKQNKIYSQSDKNGLKKGMLSHGDLLVESLKFKSQILQGYISGFFWHSLGPGIVYGLSV